MGKIKRSMSPSEALYSFAGWLTTRKDRTIMSSTDDAAPIATLVDAFCRANNLKEPAQDFHKLKINTPNI